MTRLAEARLAMPVSTGVRVVDSALGSKKAWAAYIAVAIIVFQSKLGLTDEQVDKALMALSVYIGGQSVVDASARVGKESKGAGA